MVVENVYDVIVIGAGASGLIAAWELAAAGKKVLILEARDRIGGRIHTIEASDFTTPVERGAEFIHGKLPLTIGLLKKAGIPYSKVKGDYWQCYDGELKKNNDQIEDYSFLKNQLKGLDSDKPVAAFIKEELSGAGHEDLRTTLQAYVEGYYAGFPENASTMALCKELTEADAVNFRIEGGYTGLIDYLAANFIEKGGAIKLSAPASHINWKHTPVTVTADEKIYTAHKVIITLPIGVLAANSVQFVPSIDQKIAAAKVLGFGSVIKLHFQFSHAFWQEKRYTKGKSLKRISYLFSTEKVRTWWTQYPSEVPLLTGWVAGPKAAEKAELSEDELKAEAFESLSKLFNVTAPQLEEWCAASIVTKWVTDPYTLGGYSYEVVDGAALKATISEPLDNTIFFAGEGLYNGSEIGTVEAALKTGQETARQLIASF